MLIPVTVPFSTASTSVSCGRIVYFAAADELAAHLLGEQRLDVEHRRAVHEQRDADRLHVGGQKRAAPRQRVAAAAAAQRTQREHRTQRTRPGRIRPRRVSFVSIVSIVVNVAYCTTTLTSGPFATTTLRIVFPPSVRACTAASASARSRSSSSDDAGRHGEARADLAVDLHRHDDLVGLRHLGVERRPRRLRQAVGVAEHLPQLLGRVRRERRQHHDERVDRFAQHGDRLRPLDAAAAGGSARDGAPCAVPSLNA